MESENVLLNEKEIAGLLDDFLNKGSTFQAMRGLSDKDLEAVYSLGYTLYNSGKYEDAQKAFKFLCFYNHLEKRFWLGLGASRQMLKDFDGAVQAYGYATILGVDDPKPHMHAADCFLAMRRAAEADSALSAAIHWAGDKPEHAATKARAGALLGLLNKQAAGA